MSFKIGDKVRAKEGVCRDAATPGKVYTCHAYPSNGDTPFISETFEKGGEITSRTSACSCSSSFELVASKNSMSKNLIEKFALAFKKEPEKSFIKAGIMNADETLTSDGKDLFMAYMLKKHGEEFKKDVVDPILEMEAKDAK